MSASLIHRDDIRHSHHESIRFHYYHDLSQQHQPPMVTLCRLVSQGVTVYAWAICNRRDNCHKGSAKSYDCNGDALRIPGGNQIALGRARRTLHRYMQHVQHREEEESPHFDYVPGYQRVIHFGRPIIRKEALCTLTKCNAGAILTLAYSHRCDTLPAFMQPA